MRTSPVADPDSIIAGEALAALRRHVLQPMVPRCVDREYGGFLVDFDERWRPAGPHDKTLEHAARTTIAFALIERALPGEGCDRLARHGCEFLRDAMWDRVHGGFFAEVDRSGRPRWEGLKHPHAVTYVAQAFMLSAEHLAPGEGRSWARRALGWLEDVAWDPAHGGYWGSFRRNNEPYPTQARLPTPDGLDVLGFTPGFKELNTQGDAIEMLTWLAELELGGRCAERLAWMVDLVVNRLSDASGVLPYLYRPDWRPVPDLLRVGYVFQMIHRLGSAAATIGAGPGPLARWAQLADFCLAFARHPDGGFSFAVSAGGRTWPATGPSSDLRQWWVQLEAVYALHFLAGQPELGRDARARYRRARDEQWAFVRDTLLDERHGGIRQRPLGPVSGWRSRMPGRREPAQLRSKTNGWKDPLHEVGLFLALGGGATADGPVRSSTATAPPIRIELRPVASD